MDVGKQTLEPLLDRDHKLLLSTLQYGVGCDLNEREQKVRKVFWKSLR